MGIEHHYEPCFASIPESASERWTLLRKFISHWHNLNLPLLRDLEWAAKDCEYTLNRTLPDSIREWIALSKDLIAIESFEKVMRDVFDVSYMQRFSCTTLLGQCEDDIYWTVRDVNLEVPDPPVDYIYRDIDTDKWTDGGSESRSLTSFVLGHLAYFLGTGFVRTRDVNETLVTEMESAFPVAADFDGLRVFEMTDLIAFVRPRSNYYTLIVARKNGLPESKLPECIRTFIP